MKKILIVAIFVSLAIITIGNRHIQASGFLHLRSINYPLTTDYEITSSNDEVTLRIPSDSTVEKLKHIRELRKDGRSLDQIRKKLVNIRTGKDELL